MDRSHPPLFLHARFLAASPRHGYWCVGPAARFRAGRCSGAVLAPRSCGATHTARGSRGNHGCGRGSQSVHRAAGNPVLTGYTASRLPWTRRHRPEVYRRLATILLPHDYVNFWLTGERWMEHGDASGTGWLDVRTRTWSAALLAATDPDRDLAACLPPLVAAHSHFPLAPAVASELGLPRDVRVSAGGGDNMMAAIVRATSPRHAHLESWHFGHMFAARSSARGFRGKVGGVLLLDRQLAARCAR